jgi:hypothetical protein
VTLTVIDGNQRFVLFKDKLVTDHDVKQIQDVPDATKKIVLSHATKKNQGEPNHHVVETAPWNCKSASCNVSVSLLSIALFLWNTVGFFLSLFCSLFTIHPWPFTIYHSSSGTLTLTLTGDNDQLFVVLKDKPISDAKVADVLTGITQWKQACVDVETARLNVKQLESNLGALKNRILNTKIDQVSSDWLYFHNGK